MAVMVLALSPWFAMAQTPELKTDEAGLARLTSSGTKLAAGEKIAFFGDSITMQGGYIQSIDKALKGRDHTKELGVQLLPHGLNGGRVPTVLEGKSPWGDLGAPMQQLLQNEKPTIVVIYLGINDVWHGDKGTTKDDFETGLKKMIALCRDIKAKIVLCTPSVIGEELKDNQLNQTLNAYAEVTRKLAAAEKLVSCDIHRAFLEKLKTVNAANQHQGNLTYDGVHLNDAGNGLVADLVAGAIADVTAVK
ncbi:MAG: GDSL-type esterase/lipase family protein [Pirellulaceae bacterium]